MNFDYILEKIENAKFTKFPFLHIIIDDFLSQDHINLITNDKQIHPAKMSENNELYDNLIENNWKIQKFPGCATNWGEYLKDLARTKVDNNTKYKTNEPIQSIGITFRLKSYQNETIKQLMQFLNSNRFHKALKNKFKIIEQTKIISAIQKNLSGYEISPHADIRQKCLTYLLNINKNDKIDKLDCHTCLLEFKNEYKFVQDLWEKNKHINRCWVPWEWCNVVKTTNKNNSMIMFHPDNKPATLHAIKLNYNHLTFQRTQIYGNLMYKKRNNCKSQNYKALKK